MPKLLKLLLIAAFFNALSWIILIPIWQYPDEQAHFAQVQNLAELGVFPTRQANTSEEIATSEKIFGTERDGFGNNRYTYHPEFNIDYSDTGEGLFENYIESLDKSSRTNLVKKEATHNPPFYYFLGSFFYKAFGWGDLFTRVYAVRVMSSILFIATIFIAYKIATLIFKNKILQIALPTLVAFKPMLVFASTGILPDALTNFLFSLILFFSLKIIKEGLKISTLELIGLTIIFGVLTRQQFLISIPIVSIALLYQLYRNPRYLKYFVLLLAVFLIYIYLSNTILIAFPFFTNFRVPEIFDSGFLSFDLQKSLISSFPNFFGQTIKHTVSEVWPWYWGVYRWLSLTLPPIYYQILNRLVLISFGGIIIWLVVVIKGRIFTNKDIYLGFLIIGSLVYFLIFLIWDYLFYLKRGFSFGIQGRYFFPLVIAHLTILLAGFRQFSKIFLKKYAKFAILLLFILMFVFNNLSLLHVTGSYYSTSDISTFIIQASQYKPELFKGNLLLFFIIVSLIAQIVFISSFFKFVLRGQPSVNEKH